MKEFMSVVLCGFVLLPLIASGQGRESMEQMKQNETKNSTLDLKERIFILSKTYTIINLYFAHWESIPELDIDSLYKEYLFKAIETKDRLGFDLLIKEFIAHLKNGHSYYYDRWLNETYGQPLGFVLSYCEGKWVVRKSLIEELKVGDIILKINGIDFEDFYQNNKRYINASSDREARAKFTLLTFLFPERFTLELEDGRKIDINRRIQKVKKTEVKTEGKWIEKNTIGYIKIPSFSKPEFENEAIEYVKKFSNAKVIIIDVRGNRGGRTPSKLVEVLQTKPCRFWRESTSMHIGSFKARRILESSKMCYDFPTINPEKTLFQGELIILVDRYCESACEDFVMPFKDNKRALIIGERTAGSTGMPYIYNFGNEIVIGIGSVRAYFPDGRPFEGVGIHPDIEIPYNIEYLREGRDKVLERALNIARQGK